MASAPIRYQIPAELADMDPARHHIVEASAGTGKTYLIEHRVVDLLLTGAPLEQILVVTFTEKATAELRMRLRKLLDKVLTTTETTAADGATSWLIDDDARRKLADALYGFDRAAIHTIHAFCQRVLTENAFANRRLFDQAQVAREAVFEAAFKAELRENLARDREHSTYLAAWLRSGRSVGNLSTLLFECSKQGGRLVPRFDAGVLAGHLAAAAQNLHALKAGALRAALTAAKVHPSSAKAAVARMRALSDMVAGFEERGDLAHFLVEVDTADKKNFLHYLHIVAATNFRAPGLRALARQVDNIARAVVPLDAAVANRFLAPVVERMQLSKNRRGFFDFDDMLGLVWRCLDGPGGAALAGRLRARYAHALIDEFQDTDDLQWKIFRRLYLDGDGQNRLTIIGDPKQAIYSFRGADVFTYFHARKEMRAAGAQKTYLDKSYRSTPAIVAAHNRLFLDRAEGGFFTGEITYDKPIRAAENLVARTSGDRDLVPVQLVQVLPPAAGKLLAADQRAAHATFIRDEIAALLRDPARGVAVGPADQPRPIEARDIFVLTRTGHESDEIANCLRAAAIPCALFKQEGLLQTREAAEVRDLLAALVEPRSQSARLRAFKTRFFGIPLADLPRFAELPDTHPLVGRLYEWRGLADQLSYEELFTRVVAQSGLVERELFTQPSERALTNFLHLFELLLEDAARSRCDLGELVQRLQQWIDHPVAGSADDQNVQRLESERSAVQIMTIHKAKGLEAKIVFLYGSFAKPPPNPVRVYHRGSERLVCVGKVNAEAQKAVTGEVAQEDQRLVYVALTRAVGQLYLPYLAPGSVKRAPEGALGLLNDHLHPIVEELARSDESDEISKRFALLAANGARAAGATSRDAAAEPVRPPWDPRADLLADANPAPAYARLRRERRGFVVTSYTRLKSRAQQRAPIEQRDFDGDVDRAAPPSADDLPGGAETGIFLHEVLERVVFRDVARATGFDDWRQRPEVERLFRDTMLRHDRDPRHAERAQRMVFDSLTAPIRAGDVDIPCVAACRHKLREVEFLYPLPAGAQQGFVKGFIDLLFEASGRSFVLDWKSDILPGYDAETVRQHVEENYLLQARLYGLAAAKMLAIDTPADHQARFGGILFCFLRGVDASAASPAGIYFDRPGPSDLRGFESNLAREGKDYW